MFLIVKFSYQSLYHDFPIMKFFEQRQYRGQVLKKCPKSPRCPKSFQLELAVLHNDCNIIIIANAPTFVYFPKHACTESCK